MINIIKFPIAINFQNLVTLTLKRVIFPDNHRTSIFFYGLPSLKDLTLLDCDWKKVGSVTIVCPSLQNLFLREWKGEDEDEYDDDDNHSDHEEEDVEDVDDVFEAAFQNINYHHGDINIVANELVTFSYEGNLVNDYYFLSYPISW